MAVCECYENFTFSLERGNSPFLNLSRCEAKRGLLLKEDQVLRCAGENKQQQESMWEMSQRSSPQQIYCSYLHFQVSTKILTQIAYYLNLFPPKCEFIFYSFPHIH